MVVDGAISKELPIVSGTPQALCWFLIYVDGIEMVTLSDGTVTSYIL